MSGLPSAKILTGLPKMEWKTPRDKEAFLGYLVGGRRDTREEIGKELRKRYGIKIWKSFGEEMKKTPGAIFIDPRAEVVVFLADDIPDSVLKKVLECCKVAGMIPTVGINRKEKHRWDFSFAAMGFNNPPGWLTIPNIADLDRLEAQRLAEQAALDAMEKPRPAYVEEAKVTIGDKLKLVTAKPEDLVNKYVPTKNGAMKPAAPPPTGKRGGPRPGSKVGIPKISPPGFPQHVRSTREMMGLSQGEFTKKLGGGTPQAVVSSWELGHTIPSYEKWLLLHKLCPDIPMPEGIRGEKKWKKTHAAEPIEPIGKLSAKEAFGGSAKPAVEAIKPEPVALAPAPAPVVAPTPPVPAPPVAQAVAQQTGEEHVTVKLKSGGTITLSTSVSLLKLKGPDRKFVFEIIDALQAYEEVKE